MRLIPEHVLQAEQCLNCIGDRELSLRSMGIPVIENLAVAKDGFDMIDLSSNQITELGDGFPPFRRLRSLYLGCNRISKIKTGLADSLPNLQVLILTSNRLSNVGDLNFKELSRLTNLEILSIADNPVANQPGVRQLLIENLPALKVLDFQKVSLLERKEASKVQEASETGRMKMRDKAERSSKKRRIKKDDSPNSKKARTKYDHSPAATSEKPVSREPNALTTEQSASVKLLIERAETIEQVVRIQSAIRNGTISEMLRSADPGATVAESGD